MDPTLAEIRLFAGNFAPLGWAICNGDLLSIAQNTALFSLIGTTYGGDGQTTFALPDLRGRIPVSAGQGPGLSNYELGEVTGTESYTILTTQMPAHNHLVLCSGTDGSGTSNSPSGEYPAAGPVDRTSGQPVNTRFASTANAQMNASSVQIAGGSQPVDNIMPTLGLNYIIAVEGIYPSRN